jgi:hypothetical protein
MDRVASSRCRRSTGQALRAYQSRLKASAPVLQAAQGLRDALILQDSNVIAKRQDADQAALRTIGITAPPGEISHAYQALSARHEFAVTKTPLRIPGRRARSRSKSASTASTPRTRRRFASSSALRASPPECSCGSRRPRPERRAAEEVAVHFDVDVEVELVPCPPVPDPPLLVAPLPRYLRFTPKQSDVRTNGKYRSILVIVAFSSVDTSGFAGA